MELSKRLVKLRKSNGYLQKEIAEHLNMSQSGYSLYEKGDREPDLDTLKRIAKFYDVTVDYLLGKNNMPNTLDDEQNIVKMILDDDTEVYFYDKSKVTPEKLEKMQQIYNLVFNSNNSDKK